VKRLATAALCALLAAAPAVAQQGNPFSGVNITLAAPTTTTIKSGPGTLHSVCANSANNGGTLTLYDNVVGSGAKIATLTSATAKVGCVIYDVSFFTGLTAVSATAAVDWTVTWK
jgi:hypothetical protein